LRSVGSDLVVEAGSPQSLWQKWIHDFDIHSVYANKDYESYAILRDQDIKGICQENGIDFICFKDHVIFEKEEILKSDGNPYTVFTPYKRRWLQKIQELGAHRVLNDYGDAFKIGSFLNFSYSNIPDPEEMGFQFTEFEFPEEKPPSDIILNYSKTRDFPSIRGTSRLGIHLRFGSISIRELARGYWSPDSTFISELIWRDFYSMILQAFPHVEKGAFKPVYDRIKWINDPIAFQKWCEGLTGYPLVDAGMRELNQTGFMHNRVRMVTASFLVKHLLTDWRWGESYFASKLLDYDLASNNGGWQWAAGCGTDAAPYFRIFNPEAQQKKFDPQMEYIKKWVPEIGTSSYPQPIVNHEFARKRCLETYKSALSE
jgi:deoxyribodipyrimidine photo-lyase